MGTAINHGANNDQNIIVQVTYNKESRMTAMRDPRGNLTEYEYDKLGRRTSLTNPLSQVWQTAYADVGTGESRVTMTYPGLGAGTYDVQRDFDRLGRVKSIDYNDATNTPTVSFAYDPLGNLESMTENNGTSDIRVTEYQYDQANRLRAVDFDTDGDGNVDETVSYDYDISGRRTKLTMPGSKSVTYNYDEKGRLVSLSDWDDQEATFAYDNVGRHIATVRDNGLRSRYRYDKASRLRALTHDKSFQVLAYFAYEVDKRGNRTRALEALPHPNVGSTTIEHTDDEVDYTGTWAIVGDYHETTDTDAALELAFFGDSNLSLKVGEGPDHGKFDIYLNGGLWRTIDGYAAMAAERTIAMPIQGDGPHVLRIVNRTDGNSSSSGSLARFKSLTVDGAYDLHTIEYTYDALARLLTANYQPGMNLNATPTQTYNYGFDLAGNLVNMNGTTRTYNAANQMTNDGTNTLTYDPNGNLTSDGVNSYTWDRANRMVTAPGSTSYKYDGKGNRIQQTVSTTVTDYLLDLQPGLTKVLSQDDGTNTDHFIHGPRGIFSQYDGTDWQYMAQDGLGSVRGLVSDTVSISEIASYDPYGTPDTALTGTPFHFTGEQRDANGLQFHRARYYAPEMGVWMSLDPLETQNRYDYVRGNVVNRIDATGLFDWCTGVIENHDTLGEIIYPLVYKSDAFGSNATERMINVLTLIGSNNVGHPIYKEGVGQYNIVIDTLEQLDPTWPPIRLTSKMIEIGSTYYKQSCQKELPNNSRSFDIAGAYTGYAEGVTASITAGPSVTFNGEETVYNLATFERIKFKYTAVNVNPTLLGISGGPYLSFIGGLQPNPLNTQFDTFLSQYEGNTNVYSLGGGIGASIFSLTAGVTYGIIPQSNPTVSGISVYLSGGIGIPNPVGKSIADEIKNRNLGPLTVEGSVGTVNYRATEKISYYDKTTCQVDVGKFSGDIFKGEASPIPFGAALFASFILLPVRTGVAIAARRFAEQYNNLKLPCC